MKGGGGYFDKTETRGIHVWYILNTNLFSNFGDNLLENCMYIVQSGNAQNAQRLAAKQIYWRCRFLRQARNFMNFMFFKNDTRTWHPNWNCSHGKRATAVPLYIWALFRMTAAKASPFWFCIVRQSACKRENLRFVLHNYFKTTTLRII